MTSGRSSSQEVITKRVLASGDSDANDYLQLSFESYKIQAQSGIVNACEICSFITWTGSCFETEICTRKIQSSVYSNCNSSLGLRWSVRQWILHVTSRDSKVRWSIMHVYSCL